MLDAVEPTADHAQPRVHPGESHLHPGEIALESLMAALATAASRKLLLRQSVR